MSKKQDRMLKLITDKGTSVDKVIIWKIYYDKTSKRPVGRDGYYVAVCGLDEKLPIIINKPSYVEEREAMLLVFNKRRNKNGRFSR